MLDERRGEREGQREGEGEGGGECSCHSRCPGALKFHFSMLPEKEYSFRGK